MKQREVDSYNWCEAFILSNEANTQSLHAQNTKTTGLFDYLNKKLFKCDSFNALSFVLHLWTEIVFSLTNKHSLYTILRPYNMGLGMEEE